MATSFTDVLTPEDVQYLNQLPEVLAAKAKLDAGNVVYFSLPLTETIRSALRSRLGLDLTGVSAVPMRWIKGDTTPHVDVAATRSQFQNTYLMYLNDSPGELVVDDIAYPITGNTAFVFNEGLSHATHHTANTPRLLIGPMSEQGVSVGIPTTTITQEMIDACSGVFTLSSGAYDISENLTVPASVYFSVSGDQVYFNGNNYSITIVSDISGTRYGGLFVVPAGEYTYGLQVNNLTVHAQNVVLDSSAGWFFRHGTSSVNAHWCSSTGEISGTGSGGIFGADVSGWDTNQARFGSAILCSSTGNITGAGAGGIFGLDAYNCYAEASYSWGDIIGAGAGGIFGSRTRELAIKSCAKVSYSSGKVGATAGGIFGLHMEIDTSSNHLYVADASSEYGRFIAGSNEVPDNSTWSSSWSDADASGTLNVNPWTWYSWSPNTPYRLIAPIGPGTTSYDLVAFTSQLTETTTATVDTANLITVPALEGIKSVTFIPTGGSATVDPTATVYIVGTARTTSTITLNGVTIVVAFKDNCKFSFNGGADAEVGDTVTVGAITFDLIACGSVGITNVRSSSTDVCITEKYETGENRVASVRGNVLIQDVAARPTTKFKTYADYIAFLKGSRCCC